MCTVEPACVVGSVCMLGMCALCSIGEKENSN